MKSHHFAKVAVLVAAIGFATSGSAQAQYLGETGIQETFDAWQINCDETLYCDISAFGEAAGLGYFRLVLERKSEPDAPFALAFEMGTPPEIGGKVRLKVDTGYSMFGNVTAAAENNQIRFTGLAPGHELLQALIAGQSGTVTVEQPGGLATEISMSFDGVTRALIFMDNHQGRIERTDAAIVRGGKAADAGTFRMPLIIEVLEGDDGEEYANFDESEQGGLVQSGGESGGLSQQKQSEATSSGEPSAQEAGRVVVERTEPVSSVGQIPIQVQQAIQEGPECNIASTVEIIGATHYRVNESYSIWEVPCFIAAYQSSTVYVGAADWDGTLYASLMTFSGPPNRDWTDDPEILGAEFDVRTSVLSSFAKGRGMGDCGLWQTHELAYGDGESIVWNLLEVREKVDCDGVADEPQGYPLVWRTE